ncbi:hypothetical protein R3P38DRAFT_2466486, partial [Favolaschia claudopus]
AGRNGIRDDIITQADCVTRLWAPICTAEALSMSSITDPHELYKRIHPSEVGTSLGSGTGGIVSMAKMFRDEKDVQNDILWETYVVFSDLGFQVDNCFSATAGWINSLLMLSSCPVKIPV